MEAWPAAGLTCRRVCLGKRYSNFTVHVFALVWHAGLFFVLVSRRVVAHLPCVAWDACGRSGVDDAEALPSYVDAGSCLPVR